MFVAPKTKCHKAFRSILIYYKPIFNLVFPATCIHCRRELLYEEPYLCWCCEVGFKHTGFENQKAPTPLDQLFWGRVPVYQTFALLYFQKGSATQSVLHELKYGHKPQLGIIMGRKIAEAFFLNLRGKTIEVLIPVPTHHKKKFVRGYNQSEKIAQGISRLTNIPIDNTFIFKRKQTESQTKKTNTERWSNVSGGFRQRGQNGNKYKHIAIVDDVITTGATLEALIKEIKQVYPMIEISIFAVAMAK